MPKLTIDNIPVEVRDGTTILEAALSCGIHIPMLCFLKGHDASTSCLVCAVRVNSAARLVPACATVATSGMVVESESDDVRSARKLALELLLGDHLGDCLAPCQNACPAHMDIPTMIRAIADARWEDAIAVVKEAIPLPAILGRICPNLCERACRRTQHDAAVSICYLKRVVADTDLARPSPYLPTCAEPNGYNVAIVGAGPAGLSAAYFLQCAGCACTIYDEAELPGGTLRSSIAEGILPRAVLDAEIASIARVGIHFVPSTRIDSVMAIEALRTEFSAVVLACGKQMATDVSPLSVVIDTASVTKRSHATLLQNLFISGLPTKHAVQAVAAGASVARAVMDYLQIKYANESRFSVHIGRLHEEEMRQMLAEVNPASRLTTASSDSLGLSLEEARVEAERCLHCDCRKLHTCKLRDYAIDYGAQANRFKGERRTLSIDWSHQDLVYESGKCIDCGLCVQIAADAKEALGLTFIGRGFTVRLAAPFGANLVDALRLVGFTCADACPTGALARKAGQ